MTDGAPPRRRPTALTLTLTMTAWWHTLNDDVTNIRPHIPWTIPTRFFQELPTIVGTALPLHPGVPAGMPDIAWNRGLGHNALDRYKDTNQYPLHPNVTFPNALTKAMRRGYRAAVAYMDWMVGGVLDALDASGLASKTVTVFMGDHGCTSLQFSVHFFSFGFLLWPSFYKMWSLAFVQLSFIDTSLQK